MQKLLFLLLLVPSLGLTEPLCISASVVPIQTFVQRIVGEHVDTRAMVRPGFNRAYFARNHDTFVAELSTLKAELYKLLDPLPKRKFMVSHPAWGYFTDNYGLTQVSIEHEDKEPSAHGLAALINQAKQEKIKVVFVQPQFDKRQARQLAQAIGGGVVSVDPLVTLDSLWRT